MMSRCTGVWSEVMSGCTGVWSEVMSPGGREVALWRREGGRRAGLLTNISVYNAIFQCFHVLLKF